MDKKVLKERIEEIKTLVRQNRFVAALTQLMGLIGIFQGVWRLREKLEVIETEYNYLKQYALDGVEDPSRNSMYETIRERIIEIADEIERKALSINDSTLYFNTLRYEELNSDDSIKKLIDYCHTSWQNSDIKSQEDLAARLFRKIWISFPLSNEEKEILKETVLDENTDKTIKQLIVYGTFLGLAEYDDKNKTELLAEVYLAEHASEIGIIALVCLLISFWMNRANGIDDKLKVRLEKNVAFKDDMKKVAIALLKAGDTERITKKMNEDIIPALSKLRPDIEKRMKEMKDNESISESGEFNPEWENLFEDAGMSDKLRELTELQSQGNDLMMVTFCHLKTFPFFNEISNWFVPFNSQNSNLRNGRAGEQIFKLLEDTEFFCESDKYSMAFSLNNFPDAQLKMIGEQIKMQTKEIKEIMTSDLRPESVKKDIMITKTVQNIYRFFKLFRRRNEFKDAFAGFILLSELNLLSENDESRNIRRVSADFLFARGYYDKAAFLYDRLIDSGANENEIYQKAAYCHQKSGEIERALKLYEISDLIDSNNAWNLRRLGFCSRILGKTKEALGYYNRLLEITSSDISAVLNAGHCMMDLGDYQGALKMFHKAEFLDNSSLRSLRPLAWCSLISKDYQKAERYYKEIETREINCEDALNMGHLAMIKKNYRLALERYATAKRLNPEVFDKEIMKDRKVLESAGVDELLIDLVFESVE